MQQVEKYHVKGIKMTDQKKIWETPTLNDLSVDKTESGIAYSTTENTSYSPSGAV
jgi:hypothetical protein